MSEKFEQLLVSDLKHAFWKTIEEEFIGVKLSLYERNRLFKVLLKELKKNSSIVETQ